MINVTKTYLPDKNRFNKYVDEIFNNCWLTNNGPLVQRLEGRLKEFLNVKNIILVSNGTAALQIAYKLLNLKGEIITTPFSFVATVSSQVWEGLTPVFADIDEDMFCLDAKKIEEKITDKTSAIVPVHVFGNACEVELINDIANKHNIKVIYDAAHAFDVKYKNESLLNYGDISILSFHSTKIFHSIEGGAIIVNDEKLYAEAKKLINFGFDEQNNISTLGINCKMNEFEAAMGLCVLDEFENVKLKRKNAYAYYEEKIKGIKGLKHIRYNENISLNYAYYPIVFDSEEILLEVVKVLNDNDIFPRRYFYPSLDRLCYLDTKEYMPIASEIAKRILCLPMSSSLKEEDVKKIVHLISNVMDNYN